MVDLSQLQEDSLSAISAAQTLDALEEQRVRLLGKKGVISLELQKLGKMDPEERKNFAPVINGVKTKVQNALQFQKTTLEEAVLEEQLASESLDMTLPASAYNVGKIHPISYAIEEVGDVLSRLGFSHGSGPEIETDFYNFTALNIPEDHPARQDHDTFYLKADENGERKVLRTQTSNVQIHTMENFKPPFRVMGVGRVYRRDSDLTHTPQFHQVEGLAIEEGITFAHLKGLLTQFLTGYFEQEVTTRFRPHYFPFTEPSAEVDMACIFCKGDGCRVCKDTGWIEVLGAGFVHQNVLRQGGLDPEKIRGIAFGCGIERLAMLKNGITDLRMFYESHAAFLKHFGKSVGDRLI